MYITLSYRLLVVVKRRTVRMTNCVPDSLASLASSTRVSGRWQRFWWKNCCSWDEQPRPKLCWKQRRESRRRLRNRKVRIRDVKCCYQSLKLFYWNGPDCTFVSLTWKHFLTAFAIGLFVGAKLQMLLLQMRSRSISRRSAPPSTSCCGSMSSSELLSAWSRSWREQRTPTTQGWRQRVLIRSSASNYQRITMTRSVRLRRILWACSLNRPCIRVAA